MNRQNRQFTEFILLSSIRTIVCNNLLIRMSFESTEKDLLTKSSGQDARNVRNEARKEIIY